MNEDTRKPPLTNAQKQAAHREREKAKMARYEAALREICNGDYTDDGDDTWSDGRGSAASLARVALNTNPAK